MSKCNYDCLHCQYSDCLNNNYGVRELSEVLAFERAWGISFPSELDSIDEEILEAYNIQREQKEKREAARRRKIAERMKTIYG